MRARPSEAAQTDGTAEVLRKEDDQVGAGVIEVASVIDRKGLARAGSWFIYVIVILENQGV